MKSIKKITNKVTDNFSGLAGSALLVGATLTGGAAFAAAQDGGSSGDSMSTGDLGEFPQPFVTEDGQVQTSIVLGSDAAVTDVVGATEIAGALGNAANEEGEVSTGGSTGGSWSATNGVTLDTRNDDIFFGQSINEVRDTLTEEQVSLLQTTDAFRGDQDQELEQFLFLGNQEIAYNNPGDADDEDPFVHVNNPSSLTVTEDGTAGDDTGYLYRAQANFEDGVEFEDESEDDNRNDDVYQQEFEMLGTTFTVSQDSFFGSNSGQLVLYGSQETTNIEAGQTTTLTIGGGEVTVELVGVNNNNEAIMRVDGTRVALEEDESYDVNGEELRAINIDNFEAEEAASDQVELGVGSEKMTLEDGSEVMLGEDEEDVDGTLVNFEGTNTDDGDVDNSDDVELSTIEIAFGAEDSDVGFVRAGEMYENPLFDDLAFRFGGLNPDATETGDSVSEIELETNGDDTVTASFTAEGEDGSIEWAYDDDDGIDNGNSYDTIWLEDGDGETIHVQEGKASEIQEDEYFLSDAGDFAHMWEVTNVDRDTDENSNGIASEDEAEITLEDEVTGQTVEVDLDSDSGANGNQAAGTDYVGTEVIDGQSYKFFLDGDSTGDSSGAPSSSTNGGFYVTWGDGSSVADDSSSIDAGDETTIYPALDTESGASLSLYNQVNPVADTGETSVDDTAGNDNPGDYTVTYEVPSTESTDSRTLTVFVDNVDTDSNNGDASAPSGTDIELEYDSDSNTGQSETLTGYAQVGQFNYRVSLSGSSNSDISEFGLHDGETSDNDLDNQDLSTGNDEEYGQVSAMVLQPEDDEDNEEGYVVTPGSDASSDNEIEVGGSNALTFFTGDTAASDYSSSTVTSEEDDDVELGYNFYGTHTMQDTEDQGSFTFNIPAGQSTAGAAVTDTDGSISAQEGSGGSTVTTHTPTYQYADGVLADDSNVGQVKENENVVMVGGPAANSLVEELVQENQTMPASNYTQGQGMIQMVDGFPGGQGLIVAGAQGEDTRAAAEFLADYRNNQDSLEGQSEVTIETSSGSVVS